jgi:hypothetical protein
MEKKKIETIKKTQTKKGVQTISYYYIANGLTKREYFAAMAMKSIIANKDGLDIKIERIVESAVDTADALIEELNKTR